MTDNAVYEKIAMRHLGVKDKTEIEPLIRESGKVFHNFGRHNANLEQARAILAAEIIHTVDERGLSTREAEEVTGVSYSEFSRIRNARLERFTLDRMITILGKLDENVEVSITFPPRLHFVQDELHALRLNKLKDEIKQGLDCGEPTPFDVEPMRGRIRKRKIKHAKPVATNSIV